MIANSILAIEVRQILEPVFLSIMAIILVGTFVLALKSADDHQP